MENVLIVVFEEESKAYQALSELKTKPGQSTVLEAGVIANEKGALQVKDGWTNADSATTWASGGLIGGLIGVLGGPVGMLLGASLGMLLGGSLDESDALADATVIEQAARDLAEGNQALVAVAEELDIAELDVFFAQYGVRRLTRRDVASVQAEIYQAEEAKEELQRRAREQMHQKKKEEWHKRAQEMQSKVRQDIDKAKNKLKL